MVTIKSTNRRHEFWVSNGEYSAVKRELYRKLNAAGNFYFGVRKPVTAEVSAMNKSKIFGKCSTRILE